MLDEDLEADGDEDEAAEPSTSSGFCLGLVGCLCEVLDEDLEADGDEDQTSEKLGPAAETGAEAGAEEHA